MVLVNKSSWDRVCRENKVHPGPKHIILVYFILPECLTTLFLASKPTIRVCYCINIRGIEMNADLKHSIGFDRSGRLSDHSQPFGDPWAPFWTPTVASEQKVPLDPVCDVDQTKNRKQIYFDHVKK